MSAFTIDPSDGVPLWRQIEDNVRRLVATGALAKGALVPSVRDLAKDLRVNPATVAKAYQRLVEEGVLVVRRTEGTYVSESPPVLSKDERARELGEAAERYAAVASTIGAREPEAVAEVRAALARMRGGSR